MNVPPGKACALNVSTLYCSPTAEQFTISRNVGYRLPQRTGEVKFLSINYRLRLTNGKRVTQAGLKLQVFVEIIAHIYKDACPTEKILIPGSQSLFDI